MHPEVEDKRTDRFISPAIEFHRPCFTDGDSLHGGVRGSGPTGLVSSVRYIAIPVDMNIDCYFCIFIILCILDI